MTPNKYTEFISSPQGRAYLNTIRYAEGTAGPKGYNTIFGYDYFDDFSKHPNVVNRSGGYASAAAGAYQFMPNTWGMAQKALNLSDFGPKNQDLAAAYLIDQRYPIEKIMQGDAVFEQVIPTLAPEWASLPTKEGVSYYNQPVRSMDSLKNTYLGSFNNEPAGMGSVKAPIKNVKTKNTEQEVRKNFLQKMIFQQLMGPLDNRKINPLQNLNLHNPFSLF